MPGTEDRPTAAPEPPSLSEFALALGLLFGSTVLLALLASVFPPISGWLQALLALPLLAVPGLVLRLRRAGVTIDDLGVEMRPWGRTLRVSAATMAVVFPLFVLGYHQVQTGFLGGEPEWGAHALLRWDEDLLGMPARPCGEHEQAAVWTTRTGLWIVAPTDAGLRTSLDTAPPLRTARRVRCGPGEVPRADEVVRPGPDGTWRAEPGEGLWYPLGDRRTLRLSLSRPDGAPYEAGRIATGRYSQSAEEDGLVEADRGWLWLLSYLVVHLGLVALPEEWFFRGYLQGRLDQRLGTPWRLFGADFGPGLLLAALGFALLHPILIPGGHRLLVFFPGLMFGWLRARTGHIGAAVVVHAASNVLLAVISRMYV
ncbi:MAG: myxosortase MrtP [Myxococcota bacterium]